MQKFYIVGLVLAALIEMAIVLFPGIPLGIPSEWTWARHDFPDDLMSVAGQCLPGVFGMLTLGFVAIGGSNIFSRHRVTCEADKTRVRKGPAAGLTITLLLGLSVASFVWLKACQLCAPSPHGEIKPRWVLYDPGASGYFFEAAFRMESAGDFLARYEARMEEGEVLHVGTHPPGLFLLSKGLLNLCDSVPFIVGRSHKYTNKQSLKLFQELEANAHLAEPLTSSQLAALRLLGDLTAVLAALTVFPLFYIVRRCFDAAVAWRTASVFATFCCLAVFFPKSDVMFPLTSVSAVALGVFAFDGRTGSVVSSAFAVVSGLVLWLGLMMSLAHVAVLALILVFAVVRTARMMRVAKSSKRARSAKAVVARQARPAVVLLGTTALATSVFSLATHCNLWRVWSLNLKNHAAFYDQYPRTAWKWLAENPAELGMSVGLPVALLMIAGAVLCWQRAKTDVPKNGGTLVVDLTFSIVVTVGMLWLSCRNNGESARLWCFLTPWLLILAAQVIRQEVRSKPGKVPSAVWMTLMISQMVVTIVVCARVNGFPLPGG